MEAIPKASITGRLNPVNRHAKQDCLVLARESGWKVSPLGGLICAPARANDAFLPDPAIPLAQDLG